VTWVEKELGGREGLVWRGDGGGGRGFGLHGMQVRAAMDCRDFSVSRSRVVEFRPLQLCTCGGVVKSPFGRGIQTLVAHWHKYKLFFGFHIVPVLCSIFL
jgi:hypothetical protein